MPALLDWPAPDSVRLEEELRRKSQRVLRQFARHHIGRSAMRAAITLFAAVVFAGNCAAVLNPIQQENGQPGTPGWNDFSADLQPDTISGFGSKISVNHGDSIDFYVTTTAPTLTINIFRTGYYQGIGARLIYSLGSFAGMHQAVPAPDPVTGMIACSNWVKTTTLQIPSNWVTGVYLAKLTSSTGNSSFIFFVVRDDTGTEDLVFQTSVTTYQAYNTWGGTGLYNNLTDMSVYSGPHATKVSFDRPFNPGDSNGAGHYLFWEYKFVYWMESQGYNVAYTTDIDTDLGTTPLTNHKAFLAVGHDEYWSLGMRTNVQNAINAGVNVGFFSANDMYWQIRFEPNSAGIPDRVEVGYKDFATANTPPGPDPEWGVNNSIVTTNWRDPVVNKPENGVIGVMFENETDASYPYVVQDAGSWIYDNTDFVNGSSVPGIVGYEYDRVFDNGFSPAGLTVLSTSPVVGNGLSSAANSTIYTAPSGARVFAAGTIQWSWGLANIQGNTYANAGIQQTTANILNNFILGPSPHAAFSATSMGFNGAVLGTTSAVQSVTLTSNGTAPLTISSIAVTGADPGDFSANNNCPATLDINVPCTISVTFTPTAVGNRNASIAITDNASNSPQSITLSGIGQATAAPLVSLNPNSLTFGDQTVGTNSAAQTATLTNVGTAPLAINSIAPAGADPNDFILANTCPTGSSTLAANASCIISVTFSPTLSGPRAASLAVTGNAADSPESVSLSGSAISPAVIYFKDGFESGDLSAWTLPSSDSTGQRTVQTAVINSGSYAAALTNASGQYAYISTALPGGPQSQTFTRFYFRVTNAAGGTILAVARNANGGNIWELDYNGNRQGLDIYFWNSSGGSYSIFSPNQAVAANTWYSVEIQDTQTTTGQAEVWLNGVSLGTVNADLSNANPYARLMLYSSAAGTIYIDDVVVASSYNGPVILGQTITVTSNVPASQTYNTSFSLSATGGASGNAVIFALDASSTACSLGEVANTGGTFAAPVTMTSGTGNCVIDLNQAGNASYSTATQVQVVVPAAKANQATLTVTGPASLAYGTTAMATASGGSGTGTVSFDAGTSTGCSVNVTTVQVLNATGSCALTATKAADSNYLQAVSAAVAVMLSQGTPTIAWSNPADITYGTALSTTQLDATANILGTFAYTPAAGTVLTPGKNQTLSAIFTPADQTNYKAVPASVLINVIDLPPVANNDTYSTNENTALTVSATSGVLVNDTSTAGALDPLTVTPTLSNYATAHGSVTLNADGSFTYTPAVNYYGQDSFTYTVTDGYMTSNAATVTITVNFASANQNVGAGGVVTTDVNNSGTSASVPVQTSVTSPNAGVVSIGETATTTPNPAGYTLLGQQVNINAPAATAASPLVLRFTLNKTLIVQGQNQNTIQIFSGGTLVANCSTTAGATASPDPCVASRAILSNSDLQFTIYTSHASAWNFGVSNSNTPPVAKNDSYTTNQGTGLNIAAPGVLGNDTDADLNTLYTSLVTGPSHGSLTLNSDGSFSYAPASGYSGTDSFTYQAFDGRAYSNTATVTITVLGSTTTSTPTSSLNPSTYGQSVTFTASVSPSTATGTLTFYDGITPLGSAPLSGSTASLSTTGVNAGTRSITAVYSGDGSYATSTSAALTQTVNKATTTTKLSISPLTQQYSDLASFTATLTPVNTGGAAPAPSVTFKIGTVALGTAPLTFNSTTGVYTATLANAPLIEPFGAGLVKPGTRMVTAVFNNVSANYSVSNPLGSMTITREDARVQYTGSTSFSTGGATTTTVHLTATVYDITAVPSDPAWDNNPGDIGNATVAFVNRATGAVLGTVNVIHSSDTKVGTATFDWSGVAPGSYTIGFVVGNYYTRNSSTENAAITVSQ